MNVPGRAGSRPAVPQQRAVVDRARLTKLVGGLLDRHGVLLVCAPSGYGKTVAVSGWARAARHPVAWLSLGPHDSTHARVAARVLHALGGAGAAMPSPDAELGDVRRVHRLLHERFADARRPVVLVVDEVQRAGAEARHGLLGLLLADRPRGLRLVYLGREPEQFAVARARLVGEAAVIGAAELRFSADEIVRAAARLDRPIEHDEARHLEAATDGWAAAVRLALLSSGGRASPPLPGSGLDLTAFVREEVVGGLSPELAAFVLAATTVDEVDAGLAAALSGAADADALLEECVRRGLFLDRVEECGDAGAAPGIPRYRWHAVFASRCRAIVRRSDASELRRRHRLAARRLAEREPLLAVDEALAGDDPALAAEVLQAAWLPLLVGGDVGALAQACERLPEAERTAPVLRLIHACAVNVGGRRDLGQHEYRAVLDGAGERLADDPRAAFIRDAAALSLEDDRRRIAGAIARVEAALADGAAIDPRVRAACLLLVGTTQVSIRSAPAESIATLEAAERHAEAAGLDTIARRAAGFRAFALAFAGEFSRAVELIALLHGERASAGAWTDYLGGAEGAALGWVAYWRGEPETARRHFRAVLDDGVGPSSFGGIARQYLAAIAASDGDAHERAQAAELVAGIPQTALRGIPWPLYRTTAAAQLAEAEGRRGRAAELLHRAGDVEHAPAAAVQLAELTRRLVGDDAALRLLDRIRETGRAPYVRVSALVTLALVSRARGDRETAHRRLERAVEIAAPEGVRGPFLRHDPALVELIAEHGAWGSGHLAFVGTLGPRLPGPVLSTREREVVGYLRTTLTLPEIADELGVSTNTVKTHLRTAYRKLGVHDRRAAVQRLGAVAQR